MKSERFAALLIAALAGQWGLGDELSESNPIGVVTQQLVRACQVYDEGGMAEARRALSAFGPQAIPHLVRLLEHDDDNVRWQTVLTVDQLPYIPADLLQPLLTASRDHDVDVRGSAVLSLARHFTHDPHVSATVQRCCSDPHTLVRANAWYGRWLSTGDDLAIRRLVGLLADKEWMVSQQAVWHLGQIGDRAVAPLVAAVGDTGFEGRLPAIEALGRVGARSQAAVEVLAKALAAGSPRVGRAACRALAALGPVALPRLHTLAAEARGNTRVRAVEALGEMGNTAARALPVIRDCLSSECPTLRLAAIRAAGALGAADASLVRELVALLSSNDPDFRGASSSALGALGPVATDALPALRQLAARDPQDVVRQSARQAMRHIEATPEPLPLKAKTAAP